MSVAVPSVLQLPVLPRPTVPAASGPDTTQTAVEKRAGHPLFVVTWSLEGLRAKLPLRFERDGLDAALPPSPKRRYRSAYRYLGPDLLFDPTIWATLSDFQIVLYLVDFAALERRLAQGYLGQQKGQVPFHPVSLFLAVCLRLELRLSWQELARLLGGPDGGHWRRLFGFADGQTPSASGLRYFYHHEMTRQTFDSLCQRVVTLLRDNGLVPTEGTYPGDPPGRGISVTQDGMLHFARSRHCCQLATDECFQPLAPPDGKSGEATPAAPTRPCRARELGHEGCRCDTPACATRCQQASRLDPDARYQHYAGHNHKHGQGDRGPRASEARSSEPRGSDCFGYRSVADRQPDDRFAVAWTLQSQVYSANKDERTLFGSRLAGLGAKYPNQPIGEWLDDAGVGYDECLRAIYSLGALRMVEIRAAPEDGDPARCLTRGYDGQGRPLCPFGYPLRSNGYDYRERRAKWVCAGICRRQPLGEGGPISPITDCPYLPKLGDSRSLGRIVDVGLSLPDGSTRLARDLPYGSDAWRARFGRRNLSESRNGQLEAMGLKRMCAYGLDHVTRDVQLADFILSLHTIGRLAREATERQER